MINFKDKIGSKYTPNCTILKNFLGGACPRTPLAKRMASKPEKISWPPLPNPGYAPGYYSILQPTLDLLFSVGVLYGTTSVLVGHPFDTIKTKMQAQKGFESTGMVKTLVRTLKTQQLAGLYR